MGGNKKNIMHLKIEKRQNDGIASEMCSDKKRLFIDNNLQTAINWVILWNKTSYYKHDVGIRVKTNDKYSIIL